MRRESGAALTRRILAQAWPVLIGQWAAIAFGVMDTMMVGHASPQDLAAMALGASIYASVFVGLMGVIIALSPIIGQHFGGTRNVEIGKTYTQGVWIALWLAFIGDLSMAFPGVWLVMSPVEPAVGELITRYLHALMFALPAALLFRTVYALNVAVSRPKVTMAINLVGLGLKIPLNYVLIYGKFGAPALGAAGCGVATAIVMWMSCGIALVTLARDPFYRRFQIRFHWPHWRGQKEVLRLGIPTGLSYLVEVTSFTFMALLVARLGTSVIGGHQIVANLAAVCFMLPLSLAVATSAIAAQAIGAGDALAARRASRAGLRLAIGIALFVSSAIWLTRFHIVAAYTDDAEVAAVALSLIAFVAVFHVFDATQAMAGFLLRAYKHAVAPMLIYTVSLWGIGLVGGFWIAFHPPEFIAPLGARGLWGASTVALILASVTLVAYLLRVSRRPLAESQ